MSAFINSDITQAGIEIIAKGQAGKAIQYTRIALGDGYMPKDKLPYDMTGMVSECISLGISSAKANGDGTATISAVFTNAALLVGFFYREIGLFAKDQDTGKERLYCYGNAGDLAEWIPASGSSTTIEKIVDLTVVVGRSTVVQAEIDPEILITRRDFEAHEMYDDAFHEFLFVGIRNLERDLEEVTQEDGEITLTNNRDYPFNSSIVTVPFIKPRNLMTYHVMTEIVSYSGGFVEGVEVYDRQLNGFKLKFTGSATSVVVRYIVTGGIYR